MEKLSHTTESIIDENVEKLAELFPEVVTEVREPDGTLRHTIDVDALKERVGDVAEGQRERYQFTWPGKREAKQEAYRQIDKCLRPCPEESVNWDTTQNLYVEGDNLDALKLLRNTYAGKVKMIYIDPPYNTGHDFIYDDGFLMAKADYDAVSGDYDEEGGRLVANPESNGRFHSDWCSMMYPRLLLARDLLSEDGILFVSLDDSELANLCKMLPEMFGPDNRLGMFPRVTKKAGKSSDIAQNNDYIVAIKKKASIQVNLPAHVDAGFSNTDEYLNERGPYKLNQTLDYNSLQYNESMDYQINIADETFVPGGSFSAYEARHNGVHGRTDWVWRWSKELFSFGLENGFVVVREGRNGKRIYTKTYQNASIDRSPHGYRVVIQPRTRAVSSLEFVDNKYSNDNSKKEIDGLFGTPVFDYSKPSELIKSLVNLIPDKNAVILDFFSGSATTAHAVMRLNAEDGGNRKFIMVQLPEACDEKSEAAKAGYKTICEIGKERIRRAGKKIASEVEESNRQLKLGEELKKVPDVGFRVLKIDSSNFEDVSAEPAEYTQQTLAGMADNLKPGRTADDLIIQVMLKKQIELSAPIEKLDVDGRTVFSVDDGRLVACFDRDVPVEVMTAMAKMEPDYAVMRDASFAGDDAVSNFAEIFKNYSSITEVEVI